MAGKVSLRTRLFQHWWRLARGMPLGVRGLVTDGEGRVLLVRHSYTPGWHLPGGGVEKGETVQVSLERELQEEAGVRPAGQTPLLGVFSNHDRFPNDHVLVFRVTDWRPCKASEDGEIVETGWFAPDALPEGTTPGTQARIAEGLAGQPVSAFWTPGQEG